VNDRHCTNAEMQGPRLKMSDKTPEHIQAAQQYAADLLAMDQVIYG